MRSAQSSAAEREDFEEVNIPGEQIGYDLSRFDNRESVRELRTKEAGAVPGSKVRQKPRLRLSLLTAVCCGAAIAVSVFLLMAYLDLTVITDEIAKLETEYQGLKNENVLLQTEYESRYDLNQIEEYALNELGMIKLERSQVEYVEIANPDSIRAISPQEENGDSPVTSFIADAFRAITQLVKNGGQ